MRIGIKNILLQKLQITNYKFGTTVVYENLTTVEFLF